MHRTLTRLFVFAAAIAGPIAPVFAQPSAPWRDPSPHTVRFVPVEATVRLEVLDWGGSGRPIVFLAGGGNTAHVFDEFAPKLARDHHVYGITRRGFGASGFSPSDDPIGRLRDDVLGVIDALNIARPVLAGHSIAGAEMTAVATSHPDRIAGLVYLEAGYPYAFDDGHGAAMKEFLSSGPSAPEPSASDLADFSSLQKWDASVFGFQMPEAEFRQTWETGPRGQPVKARDFPGSQFFMPILTAARRPAPISTPALVIFASPHVPEAWITTANPATQDAASAYLTAVNASTEKQANALEQSRRATRVVRLRGAHYIFLSNEADTLREMRTFLAGLK